MEKELKEMSNSAKILGVAEFARQLVKRNDISLKVKMIIVGLSTEYKPEKK